MFHILAKFPSCQTHFVSDMPGSRDAYASKKNNKKLGLLCPTPIKVKTFALARLESLKFRRSVFFLQRLFFIDCPLGSEQLFGS